MNAVKMCASIRSRTVFREELQLPDVAFLVEGLDGALPFLALRAVQLAEVERLRWKTRRPTRTFSTMLQ